MFKVNNKDTRKSCEICSKLTIKLPERRHQRCFGVFNVNFKHISYFTSFFSVSIVDFEQVNVTWVDTDFLQTKSEYIVENNIYHLVIFRKRIYFY